MKPIKCNSRDTPSYFCHCIACPFVALSYCSLVLLLGFIRVLRGYFSLLYFTMDLHKVTPKSIHKKFEKFSFVTNGLTFHSMFKLSKVPLSLLTYLHHNTKQRPSQVFQFFLSAIFLL